MTGPMGVCVRCLQPTPTGHPAWAVSGNCLSCHQRPRPSLRRRVMWPEFAGLAWCEVPRVAAWF